MIPLRGIGIAIAAMLLAGAATTHSAVAGRQTIVKIGTSDDRDITYEVAGALCSMINRAVQAEQNILCLPVPQAGSVINARQILNEELSFAIVQSDTAYKIVQRKIAFPAKTPASELRLLFSLFPMPFHAVARGDAGVKSFEDFRNRRFNSGPIGSGTQSALTEFLTAKGWNYSEFSLVHMFNRDEVAGKLCDGEVDGYFLGTGLGAEAIIDSINRCNARLLALDDPAVQTMVHDQPYYHTMIIPAGTYPNQIEPVSTFGVTAVLISRASVPNTLVYDITRAVLGDLDGFKALHRGLAGLQLKDMVDDQAIAPYHDGATAYFQELGLP